MYIYNSCLDNTTITVSYSSTTHVRDITNTNSVLIPVMTDNVAISCDAEEGKWSYYIGQTGTAHTGASNPVNIDLFTKEYALTFDCKKRESSYSGLRTVHSVTVVAVGKYLDKIECRENCVERVRCYTLSRQWYMATTRGYIHRAI